MDDMYVKLLVSLVLTAVAYMAFPLIRLAINRGKFEKTRAHKIALWNSIVLGAFFCILTSATSKGNVTWNAAPAFLYYGINCAILTDKYATKTTTTTTKRETPAFDTTTPIEKNTPESSDIHINVYDIGQQYRDTGGYKYYSHIPEQNKDTAPVVAENTTTEEPSVTPQRHDEKAIPDDVQPVPTKPILFCRKCGNKLAPDSAFCNKCGTKIL